ncbi:MAG: hypothetical protein NWE93_02650 [Candidatus Bathyarchaeota archaeon]|nr:hypothetical protein [Candidatus Bathyarchaeota archaeon]
MRKTILFLLVAVLLFSSLTINNPADSGPSASKENTWTEKAPMQQARCDLGVAVVDGKIYAIGGNTENGEVATNEEYDPATDTWVYKASMPTSCSAFAITVYNNKIYCFGNGKTQVYDPATDTWEIKTSPLITKVWATANAISEKIYVLGGYPNTTVLEVYEPATDSWSMKNTGNFQPFGPSCVYDEKIYVIWGLTIIYEPSIDNWTYGVPPPTTSGGSGGIGIGIGATTDFMAPKRVYIFDPITQVYRSETGTWLSGEVNPLRYDCSAVAVVNDQIYVIGGYSEAYVTYPDDWIYGPQRTWYATNLQYTPFGYVPSEFTPSPSAVSALDSSSSFPVTQLVIICAVVIALACVGAVFLVKKAKK